MIADSGSRPVASSEANSAPIGFGRAGLAAATLAINGTIKPGPIWPDVTPTNSFRNQSREGGAMQQHMFWALFIHAQDAQDIADDPDKQAEVWNDLRDLRQRFREGPPWERGQTALRHVPPLEHADAFAPLREISRANQTIVPAADDDAIVSIPGGRRHAFYFLSVVRGPWQLTTDNSLSQAVSGRAPPWENLPWPTS